MPKKIDLFELLESDSLKLDQLKDSLGKKTYALYEKIVQTNGEATPLQKINNLMQLAKSLREDSTIKHGFGLEKSYKELLAYALAAKLSGTSGIKIYNFAIQHMEDCLYKYEMDEDFFRKHIEAFKDAVTALKSTPPSVPTILSDPTLQTLISKASSLREERTLGENLDLHYEIYQRATDLLSSESITKKDEITAVKDCQAKALHFLEFVLDNKGINRINQLMKIRLANRPLYPENIPGTQPIRSMPHIFNPKKASTPKRKLLYKAHEIGALQKKNLLLEVNEGAKKKDEHEQTVFIGAKERDAYRCLLNGGKVYQRQADNTFDLYDTWKDTSKIGRGYAACTVNYNGELSLFSHYDAEKPFFHSSLNAQAAVFWAGEIKIVNGQIAELTSQSGHYKPDKENTARLLAYLKDRQVDISQIVVTILVIKQGKPPYFDYYKAEELLANPKTAQPFKTTQEAEQEEEAQSEQESAFDDEDFGNTSDSEHRADISTSNPMKIESSTEINPLSDSDSEFSSPLSTPRRSTSDFSFDDEFDWPPSPTGKAQVTDPFADTSTADPFASSNDADPFASTSTGDPFASSNDADPFASTSTADPFASSNDTDPFASTSTADPFASPTVNSQNKTQAKTSSEKDHHPFNQTPSNDPFFGKKDKISLFSKAKVAPPTTQPQQAQRETNKSKKKSSWG
jgi:hypothetical protein